MRESDEEGGGGNGAKRLAETDFFEEEEKSGLAVPRRPQVHEIVHAHRPGAKPPLAPRDAPPFFLLAARRCARFGGGPSAAFSSIISRRMSSGLVPFANFWAALLRDENSLTKLCTCKQKYESRHLEKTHVASMGAR